MLKQAAKKVLSSLPVTVNISAKEHSNGHLTWQNVERATRAIHRDGLVVLENAIPDHGPLDKLNAKMIQDVRYLQNKKDSPFNYNKGNLRQDPPIIKDFYHPSIYFNKFATQVVSSVMGPGPRWTFASGNSSVPNDEQLAQPTHSDADFDHPDCPFALVVNVPLIDMTVENGSTEVWLGTHTHDLSVQEGKHGERASGRIKKDLLEARREIRPPSQPHVKKGSVVIRDLRLWHGGMPNKSQDIRVMLAFINFAPWFRNAMKVEIARDLEQTIAQDTTGIQVQAKYIAEAELLENYLDRPFGNAYKFDQEDKVPVDG